MSPWVGVWDLAWQSPLTGVVLLAAMIVLVMAGVSLAARDGHQ